MSSDSEESVDLDELLDCRLKAITREAKDVLFCNRIRYLRHHYVHDALCKAIADNPNDLMLHSTTAKLMLKPHYGLRHPDHHQYMPLELSAVPTTQRAIPLNYRNTLNVYKRLHHPDPSLGDPVVLCSPGMQPTIKWIPETARGGRVSYTLQRMSKMFAQRQRFLLRFVKRMRRRCYKNMNAETVSSVAMLMHEGDFFSMYDMFALLPMQSCCMDEFDDETSSSTSVSSDEEPYDADIDMHDDNLLLEQMNLYLWRQRQRNCRHMHLHAHAHFI